MWGWWRSLQLKYTRNKRVCPLLPWYRIPIWALKGNKWGEKECGESEGDLEWTCISLHPEPTTKQKLSQSLWNPFDFETRRTYGRVDMNTNSSRQFRVLWRKVSTQLIALLTLAIVQPESLFDFHRCNLLSTEVQSPHKPLYSSLQYLFTCLFIYFRGIIS